MVVPQAIEGNKAVLVRFLTNTVLQNARFYYRMCTFREVAVVGAAVVENYKVYFWEWYLVRGKAVLAHF